MRLVDLKNLYLSERKKLESLSVFQQESKIQIILLRKKILEKAKEDLNLAQIEGRVDIDEETKDLLLRDADKSIKLEERIDKIIEEELRALDKEEEGERRNARYEPWDFGEYLVQLEKVTGLENAIVEAQSYPHLVSENIYGEPSSSESNEQGGER